VQGQFLFLSLNNKAFSNKYAILDYYFTIKKYQINVGEIVILIR